MDHHNDNPTPAIDLDAERAKRPRRREVYVLRDGKPWQVYTLIVTPGERFGDIDAALLVDHLVAAELTFNGDPLSRDLLHMMPFGTLAMLVKYIDNEIMRQDQNLPARLEMSDVGDEYISVDLFVGGCWRTITLRAWGSALREAGQDAVALRTIFDHASLRIDGISFGMPELARLDDIEVLSLSLALQQAALETVHMKQRQANGD